jgi:iron complex outermembrane receptor protein
MKVSRVRTVHCVLLSIFISVVAFNRVPAHAETLTPDPVDPPTTPITELTVYGGTREAPLKEVPASVVVLPQGQSATQGVAHFDSILEMVPTLTQAGGSNRSRFFQIRGVGEVEQYEGAPNPSVGFFIDDLDLSSLGGVGSLFDIDTVEVLRGPQGTRYGSSALAGAIHLRSQDPSSWYNGIVQSTLGNDDLHEQAFAVGGPIIPDQKAVQFRLSAVRRQQDGFRNNVFLNRDDTNARDELSTRLKIALRPSEHTTIDVAGYLFDFDNGYDAFAIDNSFTTQSDRPGDDVQRTGAGTFKVTHDLGDTTFIALSSYMRTTQRYSYDGDWGNNPFWSPYAPYDYFSATQRERQQYNQEFRLVSSQDSYKHGETPAWTAGLFGGVLIEDGDTQEDADGAPYDTLASEYEAQTGAFFGSYEVPLQPSTAITFSGRVERRAMTYRDSRPVAFNPGDTMLGGGVTLTHDLSSQLRGYFGITRGFKGGGFNNGLSIAPEQRVYQPEYLWNIEGGLKGGSNSGTVTATLATFLMLRRDAQSQISIQDDPADPLAFTYLTDNASRGRVYGVEGEVVTKVGDALTLTARGGVSISEATAGDASQATLIGREFAHAPTWQYALSSTYDLSDDLRWDISTTGRDSFYFGDNFDAKSSRAFLLNTSLLYRLNNWSISFWARNILDERYESRGFFFGNEPPDFPARVYVQQADPRTFGGTVQWRW